ncbi:MAG: chorismate-binding protein [Pseudomonadales bacterium]|nr:chorismate-binding protein [Pseudomonadales bacterium]MBO6563756.1 chorismate-binding protein [Pseudomonadales bacterium]MBO6596811.1 chorismate-binding protein [Pseudomonadales bacterium]MBO6658508.1 chorismate-binding protein [Pseudomonadales bacterium]MBO6703481.1 chorismate-binding protein [Pseudomonadales bacterium]
MISRVLVPDESGDWLEFQAPKEVLTASSPDDVLEVLRVAETAAIDGAYVAGYVSYEAASAFDPALSHHVPGGLPLVSFAIFDKPVTLGHIKSHPDALALKPSLSRQDYGEALRDIKKYLAEGDTYQVNFTQQLLGELQEFDADALMARLSGIQPTPYAMMIESADHVICCVSPELFFERTGEVLRTEPMKGTRPRGRFTEEDEQQYQALIASHKDRAENLMIVDMIRNDLGRVANTGTVAVDEMFQIKALPTVWQQVSSITAETNANLVEVFRNLFPCASVTGAPKARTMEIIRELESDPRGVYTGAVGMIRPGGDCCFAVAIRTLVVDKTSGAATYGVGGGIVWDSDIEEEWQEAMTKSAVLNAERPDFQLLETMRFDPADGVERLDYHLARLSRSAGYFGYACSLSKIRTEIDDLKIVHPCRLRLLLDADGTSTLEQHPLPDSSGLVRLRLAPNPVNSSDVFLFHKTTHRHVYEAARNSVADCDDVLLYNEKGELTETSIANVFLEIDGNLKTPAVSCGLLAGTLRQEMLDQGLATEAILTREDLKEASRLYVANSLRGMREAELLDDK